MTISASVPLGWMWEIGLFAILEIVKKAFWEVFTPQKSHKSIFSLKKRPNVWQFGRK